MEKDKIECKKATDISVDLSAIAKNAALRVEFITSGRELYLYENAIYNAMKWGWGNQITVVDTTTFQDEILIKK